MDYDHGFRDGFLGIDQSQVDEIYLLGYYEGLRCAVLRVLQQTMNPGRPTRKTGGHKRSWWERSLDQ